MRLGLATAILIFSVGFGASIASAGEFDNPNLLDVDSTFSSVAPKGASENTAFIRQSGSENRANGRVTANTGDNTTYTHVQISWNMYEPDQAKRDKKGGKLSQKSWVAIDFSTWMVTASGATGTWDSTVVEKCKASTKVKGTEAAPTGAQWKVSCKGALAALAEVSDLGPDQLAKLELLLGNYVSTNKDKINIKGKGPVD